MNKAEYDDWRNWGGKFSWLACRGELPLPEDLSKVQPSAVTHRVRNVIGITTTIPKEFCGTFNVDGHKVHVFRHGNTPLKSLRKGRRYFHRVFIEVGAFDGPYASMFGGCCVSMGAELVPIGRLWQKFNSKRRSANV